MADKINVVWKTYHPTDTINRGYWDQGILEDIFKVDDRFVHHDDFAFTRHPWNEGAIVIINGRTHTKDTARINADLSKLRWVLFIETGDEEAVFPWREIKHPIMRVWVQLPRMNQHNDVSYHLVNGYRAGAADILDGLGQQQRTTTVYFAGQVNHDRREQCVEAMKALDPMQYPNNILMETSGFGQEIVSQTEYLTIMAQSKIVLCPSGVESPDTFRLYEALEAGCIPIVDAFATRNQDWGFWNYLFKGDVPFPIISYWDKLPDLLPELLNNYPENANKIFSWWQLKKREIKDKLYADVKELSK